MMLELLLLLLMLLFAPAATTTTPSPTGSTPMPPAPELRLPYTVERARLLYEGDALVGVEFAGLKGANCTGVPVEIVQRHENGTLYLDIVDVIDIATTCPAAVVPVEHTIRLIPPLGDQIETVVLNGLSLPAGGDEPVEAPADFMPATMPEPPETARRLLMLPDVVTALYQESHPMQLQVEVVGNLLSGCTGLPLEIVQRVSSEAVAISISEIIGQTQACPAVLVPFATTLPVFGTFESYVPIVTNGVQAGAGAPADGAMRSPIYVDSVTARITPSTPAQITLDVVGALPNGCTDQPVEVTQNRSENSLTVQIVHVVPTDIMCPMVITPFETSVALDGTFAAGTYILQVNDYQLEPITVGGN